VKDKRFSEYLYEKMPNQSGWAGILKIRIISQDLETV